MIVQIDPGGQLLGQLLQAPNFIPGRLGGCGRVRWLMRIRRGQVLFPLGIASVTPAPGGSLAHPCGLGDCDDPAISFCGHIPGQNVKN